MWYRTEKSDFKKCRDFEKAFSKYIGYKDDDDWTEELKSRKQGKNEKIAPFLTSLWFIADNRSKPIKEKKLVKIAIKNLKADYRGYMQNYMQSHEILTLKTLKSLGLKFETFNAEEDKPVRSKIAAVEEVENKVSVTPTAN